jgi:hypothetical protein
MTEAKRDIKRKLAVLNHIKQTSNISKSCLYFGISLQVYYNWKRRYDRHGDDLYPFPLPLFLLHTSPGPLSLSLKVERSHGTDQKEFYQLLTYQDDVDLNKKLKEWKNFYNYYRPHTSL